MTRPSLTILSWALVVGWVAGVPGSAAAQDRAIRDVRVPESVVVGPDGRIFATEVGEYEKYFDGAVVILEGNRKRPFVSGLNDPHGIDAFGDHLYVADNRGQIWKIDLKGNVERFVDATQFPRRIMNFNDIEIDDQGNVYVSDSGDWDGGGGAIYRISQDGTITTVLTNEEDLKLVGPNGLLMEGPNAILVVDYVTGRLFRLDLNTKAFTKVNEGFGYADGLARDRQGRLYVSDFGGRLFVLDKPDGEKKEIAVKGMQSAADITISADGRHVIVPDWEGNQVLFVPVPR